MSKKWSRAGDAGPLAPYASGYGTWLERLGYAPSSVQQRLWLMGHLSRWLDAEGVDAASLTPTVLEAFVAARHGAGWAYPPSAGVLLPLLAYLQTLGVAAATEMDAEPSAAEALLERFREQLMVERGLSARSACLYAQAVRPFVVVDVLGDTRDLGRLTAGDITRFVLEVSRACEPAKAKTTMTALRALLRFLHREGLVASSLVGVVPTPASRRLAGLPRALMREQVAALLDACDRDTVSGRRDFAIMLLLVRLGYAQVRSPAWSWRIWTGAPGRSPCAARAATASGCPCPMTWARRSWPGCNTVGPPRPRDAACSCGSRLRIIA